MALNPIPVEMPVPMFTLMRSFKALFNGTIYVGKPNTDPVNPVNQIPIYVRNESGDLVQVAQPILTNAGGYTVYNGEPSKFFVFNSYSLAAYDSYGALEIYDDLTEIPIATPGTRLGPPIRFTTSGTYTPTPGAKTAYIIAVGGGGGGGGVNVSVTDGTAAADGGQSGAYAELYLNVDEEIQYTVTIGVGGTAGLGGVVPTNGGVGGSTTVTGIVSCPGGAGGTAVIVSNTYPIVGDIITSATMPSISSGVTVCSLPADGGFPAINLGVSIRRVRGGRGGSNRLGIGGNGGFQGAGKNGVGYGSGGGGAASVPASGVASGGAGSGGVVIIEEYA
ncbi:TPA: phage tailspike protein [Yersinia enterocolitica]